MTTHSATFPEDRELSTQESHLLAWLLDHGAPLARSYIDEIPHVRVVSHCGCGCASIDFVEAPGAALEILSDHKWQDTEGHSFGVFVFAKAGRLAGLEVWSIDGADTPSYLPDSSQLEPI